MGYEEARLSKLRLATKRAIAWNFSAARKATFTRSTSRLETTDFVFILGDERYPFTCTLQCVAVVAFDAGRLPACVSYSSARSLVDLD